MSTDSPPPLLALRGISRRFPGVIANDDIDLTVRSGDILGLLGENGAGKSTLMKILAGLLVPDDGQILWKGQPVAIQSPAVARQIGIGMVHQHFALFEGMTVAENVALSLPGAVPGKALEAKLAAVTDAYGLSLDPGQPVFTLSAGEKQRIEIVRALLPDPQLLILDEPTSVLTPQEAEQLFATLRRLAADGRSVVFISHKLDEVRRLCSSATILRGGRVVATCDPRTHTAEEIAELMLGSRPLAARRAERPRGEPLLSVIGLDAKAGDRRVRADDLQVCAGEILGVAGVAGNGQSALYRLLSGEVSANHADAIAICGRPVGRQGPNPRRKLGAAFLPEERLGHSAAPDFGLTGNALLSNLTTPSFQRRGWIFWPRLRRHAGDIAESYDVRHSGLERPARSLSGGNLQKFVVGRELTKAPRLLVVNQPTWGVDMGAAGRIRQAIQGLAQQQAAVVVISQDLDELLDLCDRLAVIHDGVLSPARPVGEWTIDALGLAMAGADQPPTLRKVG